MKIKVKYHTDNVQAAQINVGDWIDLRAAEDTKVWFLRQKRISLGISIELPKGYEAHVLPRSSTPTTFGIVMSNSQGIIDNSYCGDDDIWQFPALGIRFPFATIHKGDRIAQFRTVKTMRENFGEIDIEEVICLGNKNRGGFGSTGIQQQQVKK